MARADEFLLLRVPVAAAAHVWADWRKYGRLGGGVLDDPHFFARFRPQVGVGRVFGESQFDGLALRRVGKPGIFVNCSLDLS